MAYIITKTNGTQLVIVDDGTIDVDSSDLNLIGKNYAGYGFAVNQNFVKLLENFANSTAPANPLTGQTWYDTSEKKLKIFNGTEFKGLPVLESSSYQPSDLLEGDLWFDSSESKLYYYDGSAMNLIGPQFSGQVAVNSVLPAILEDIDGFKHYVLKHQIQNYSDESVITTVAITSSDEFDIDAGLVPGYTKIKQGITLYGTNPSTGISASSITTDPIIWGTSSDALRLEGRLPSEYVLYTDPTFNVGVTVNSNSGVNIASSKLRLFVDSATNKPRIASNSDELSFSLSAGAATYNVFNLDATSGLAILPSKTTGNVTNIGSPSLPFNILYCNGISSTGALVGDLTGTATSSDTLKLGGVYVAATTTNTINTIVARDASGNFSAGTVTATATTAQYADLAEKYKSDTFYEPGTVLEIGGIEEVTLCTEYCSEKIVGVVSSDPAYLMNSGLNDGVSIALRGRVPCKVTGTIRRGDALVSSAYPGYATARDPNEPLNPLTVIGKALQDFDGEVGIIEILV